MCSSDSSYLYLLAVRQLSKHRQWVAELQHQQHQQAAFRPNDKSARLFAQRNARLVAEVPYASLSSINACIHDTAGLCRTLFALEHIYQLRTVLSFDGPFH
jgi:hypothetical protein